MNKYFLLMVIFVTACARTPIRGVVAHKVSDKEAHVTLGRNEISEGDPVILYKNVCEVINSGNRGDSHYCRKEKVGRGKVVEILGAHYSLIELSGSGKFEEGTFVERD